MGREGEELNLLDNENENDIVVLNGLCILCKLCILLCKLNSQELSPFLGYIQ